MKYHGQLICVRIVSDCESERGQYIDSAPSLGVYYFFVADYVCMSVGNHAKCCGPTLVSMATTFVLGAESNRLPACYVLFEL